MALPEFTGSDDPSLTWVEYTKLAVDAPGVDPLEAIVTSDPEGIPRYGYLIAATIQPGLRAGTVEIEKYDGIGFEEVEAADEFGARHGTRRIYGTAYSTTIRCGKADDVFLGGDAPQNGKSFTPSGGRVTELDDRVVVAERLSIDNVQPREVKTYDPARDQYLGEHAAAGVEIVRAVTTVEEAITVVAAASRGMGLRHGDFQGFMNAALDRLTSMIHPDTVEYERLRELVRIRDESRWLQRLGTVTKGLVEIDD